MDVAEQLVLEETGNEITQRMRKQCIARKEAELEVAPGRLTKGVS